MKKLLAIMALSVGLLANAQTVDLLKPAKDIALRAPSVPIIVSDPYFSIWSPYDKLMEGSTEHWTSAKKPLLGALRVDGKVYRFLGKDKINLVPIAPMTNVERWEAAYTNSQPSNGWQEFQFDDSNWKKGKAAFGSRDMERIHTEWKGDNTDIYIRRTFDFNEPNIAEDIYLIYSHDDVFELYLNGEKLISTGLVWKNNVYLKLSEEAKKKLRKGKNVIAAHCHNTTGGSYVDFGLFREKENAVKFANEAVQKSVDVLATSTYYTFTCGPVELDVVFTAPQLIDDLDLLSTPINYVSYRVRSLDKKTHDVQFYMETTPELAINESNQPTVARTLSKNGISYVEAGSIDQPICDRRGDLICADWGYAYLASTNGSGKSVSLGDYYGMKESFVKNGTLATTKTKWTTRKEEDNPAMAYVHNLGSVSNSGKEGFMMLGYDDIYSIEYMYEKRMGYWKHDGKVTIFDAFEKLRDNYQAIMERCRAFDELIYDDAEKAGGKKYAEICSASYRQVISAHKLFTDKEGNLLWFSKENNSNGCVNTVDLTYPSAPLFLVYNPELQKAMMTSIFEYSASGRWNKPFPAHDLGTYPIANGQVYGGDMPIEEGGNMVILAAAITHTIFQRSRRCDRGGTHTGNVTVGKSRSQKLSPFELTHARHFQHQVPSCSRKGTFARTIHCDLGFLPAIHISIINGHTGQRTIQIPAHKIRDRLAHSRCLHRRCILAYHLPFVNRHTRNRHRQASATNIGFELAHSHTFDRNRRFIDPGLGKNGGIIRK